MPKLKQLPPKDSNTAEARRHSLLKDQLTERESLFVNAILEGKSVAAAGKLIGLKDQSSAYKRMRKPRVAAFLEEALKRAHEKRLDKTSTRIARRWEISDCGESRLLQMLQRPSQDPVAMMVVGIAAKSRAKPEEKHQLIEQYMGKRDDPNALPIADEDLLDAIALSQKIAPKLEPQQQPPGAMPANWTGIVADQVHIHHSEALPYESAWIRKQHGIDNPAATALEAKFGLAGASPQSGSSPDAGTAVAPEDPGPDSSAK